MFMLHYYKYLQGTAVKLFINHQTSTIVNSTIQQQINVIIIYHIIRSELFT
jgi:hypothetical protein